MLWTWLNIKICRFFRDSMGKKPLLVQKRPAQKTTFSKKFHFFNIFLVLKHWVTLLKYKYQKKEKKIRPKSAKKMIFRNFFKKKFFFLSDFLEFLFFFLNLELNPHIHLFFQLSSCTGWFTIKDFPIFQKTAFFAFFWTLPLQLGCFFWQNQPWPSVINCS